MVCFVKSRPVPDGFKRTCESNGKVFLADGTISTPRPLIKASALSRLVLHAASSSELEPQRELNLPAVSGRNGIGNGPGRRANVIAARKNNQIGVAKVRVIESVEDLRPKLQIHLLF